MHTTEQINELVIQIYDKYLQLCHDKKLEPEVNLNAMATVVLKARIAITDMIEKDGAENKPFVAIKIDSNFSHTAQVEDNQVNVGVVERAALLYQFQQGDTSNVTQDNNESGDQGSINAEEMPH